MKGSVAVYPGSFDPITNGHVDIISRASKVFDKLVVLIAVNSEKKGLFTLKERCELIREVFKDCPNIEVDSFEGLLVEYLKKRDIPVVIRGLRAVSDFEYEFQMALMNRRIYSGVETFFMASSENCSYISSRIVKEIFSLGASISDLAPEAVVSAMNKKFAGSK
ncbi:MAG: pantetheine-phosphate adenylyltransferase [Deltaproteobacteria bacterium]|nr:MAG: pantetheine-phosphate adenylyltransferase [Deltaproteobacteria bacterium]